MPVHVHLRVERGIHIIECLNMEQLAAEHVYEFVFAALPLKIRRRHGIPDPAPWPSRNDTDVCYFVPGEEIDARAWADYLRGKLEGVESGVRIEQFSGGHSNLTYLIPPGDASTCCAARRSVRWRSRPTNGARVSACSGCSSGLSAGPPAFLLCEDSAVIGAIFSDGTPAWRGAAARYPDGICRPAGSRPARQRGFADCLAALHKVDVERGSFLGKPAGFLERQVRGWADRWERSKTEEIPEMSSLIRWLVDRMPESGPPTLVHNDYKLDNLMLDASDPGRVEAVLDWEMTTVGDPLVDLGCTLCYWTQADDPADAAKRSAKSWRSRDGSRARR